AIPESHRRLGRQHSEGIPPVFMTRAVARNGSIAPSSNTTEEWHQTTARRPSNADCQWSVLGRTGSFPQLSWRFLPSVKYRRNSRSAVIAARPTAVEAPVPLFAFLPKLNSEPA